jgi:hypothetical protein
MSVVEGQKVAVKWNSRNKKYYEDIGYTYTKMGEVIGVEVFDLPKGSQAKVKIICDYCESEVEKLYQNYLREQDKSPIRKDCCKKCYPLKFKESNLMIYGVENPNHLPEVVLKRKNTTLERYGVENVAQLEEVQDKMKSTNMDRYGVEVTLSCPIIREKIKATNLEKYGVAYPGQTEIVQSKQKITNLKKYGFEYAFQSPIVINKIHKSLYQNGTAPCSRPQKYIHSVVGGKLNYPVSNALLDIAFPEEMIYLEYDGGGHSLSVKLGSETQEKFETRNRRRWYALNRKGWKEIRIVSSQDFLPNDSEIEKMIIMSKEYFSTGRSWVEFNIDEGKIKCSKSTTDYIFEELRTIKDSDFKESTA